MMKIEHAINDLEKIEYAFNLLHRDFSPKIQIGSCSALKYTRATKRHKWKLDKELSWVAGSYRKERPSIPDPVLSELKSQVIHRIEVDGKPLFEQSVVNHSPNTPNDLPTE